MKAKKSAPSLSSSQRKKWLTLLQPSAVALDAGSSNRKDSYKVVIDTTVLISDIFFGGHPEAVIKHAIQNQQIVLSDYIIDELITFIRKQRPRLSQRWVRLLRQKLEVYCQDYDLELAVDVRDINDADIVRLAMSAEALIVTGDKDLLEYRSDAKVQILSVSDYSELFMVDYYNL